jgi:mRNA-degrading endonuclease toxin of MazEF toxin-antitoxin module
MIRITEDEKMSSNKKLKDNSNKLQLAKKYLSMALKILEEQDEDNALFYSEWVNIQAELKYIKQIDPNLYIINNCIYWAFLGSNIGSEQELHRPVLIVQTSKNSPICSVIPLTLERLNDGYWYHIDLDNGTSTALVEHLRVISKKRIDKPLRHSGKIESITENDRNRINNELRRLYTLKPLK